MIRGILTDTDAETENFIRIRLGKYENYLDHVAKWHFSFYKFFLSIQLLVKTFGFFFFFFFYIEVKNHAFSTTSFCFRAPFVSVLGILMDQDDKNFSPPTMPLRPKTKACDRLIKMHGSVDGSFNLKLFGLFFFFFLLFSP